MAGVDDAESVPFRVSQHHGVSIGGVVPRHAGCTKLHEPIDLGRLLGRAVDHEVEMDPRPLLDWCDRSMYGDARADAVGRNQDREVVTGVREADDFVAQHVSPEGGGTIQESRVLAPMWEKEFGVPHDVVNVNGSGISLGHPVGASGARIMTTLLHELERSGARTGFHTMCEGGGQANAIVIERLD